MRFLVIVVFSIILLTSQIYSQFSPFPNSAGKTTFKRAWEWEETKQNQTPLRKEKV
jgi:hypothetical protein